MQNIKAKRITAWIATVAIVFVMLFSIIYIPKHLDHDCTGAECPVCAVMEQCMINIKNIGTIIAVIVTTLFLCLSIKKNIEYVYNVYSVYSLISQKVRLND